MIKGKIVENLISRLSLLEEKDEKGLRLFFNFSNNEECLDFFIRLSSSLEKIWINYRIVKEKSVMSKIFEKINDEILFNQLISAIVFKNLLKNRTIGADKNLDDIEPFYVNSDTFLNDCSDSVIGFLVYYDIDLSLFEKFKIEKDVRAFMFKIVSFLINTEEKLIILKKKQKIKGSSYKTISFYGLKDKLWFLDYRDYCDISFKKLKVKSFKGVLFLIGDNFNKCSKIFKENKKSASTFILKDDKIIDKLLNQKVFIDKENLDYVIEKIEKLLGFPYYDLEIKVKSLYFLLTDKNLNLKKRLEISQEISKNLNFLNIIMLRQLELSESEPFYFKFSFDFRGRFYYDSCVGITNSKLSRYVYHYGIKNKNNLEYFEVKQITERMDTNDVYLHKTAELYNIEKNIKNLNYIYWILIAIGKNFIKKNSEGIEDTVFIKNGLNFIEKKEKLVSLDEKSKDLVEYDLELDAELNYLCSILKDLKNNEIRSRPISKDATASVIQNYIRVLGPKNENSLKITNISGGYEWFDTYSSIISYFKEKTKIKEELGIYFNRKTLKKTIMTVPYQASMLTCKDYFIQELSKMGLLPIKEKTLNFEKETEEIIFIFKKFYNFLKNELEGEYLYEKSSEEVLNVVMEMLNKDSHVKNEFRISFDNKKEFKNLNVHDYKNSNANLIYFKMQTKFMDFLIPLNEENTIRATKEYKYTSKCEIDIRKIGTSFKANYVHFCDAEFLRMIMNKLIKKDMQYIHDCILTPVFNINNLIYVCNDIMLKGKIEIFYRKKKKPFSIFILI